MKTTKRIGNIMASPAQFEPEKAAGCFDFADSPAALATICDNLRNVVESAIRHQVANMTIEAVVRKRGSIILQLKDELGLHGEPVGTDH